MTFARVALLAAAVLGATAFSAPASAFNTDFRYLNNKPYMNCIKLFYYNGYMMPSGLSPAGQAAYKEKGRRMCNRNYGYGN